MRCEFTRCRGHKHTLHSPLRQASSLPGSHSTQLVLHEHPRVLSVVHVTLTFVHKASPLVEADQRGFAQEEDLVDPARVRRFCHLRNACLLSQCSHSSSAGSFDVHPRFMATWAMYALIIKLPTPCMRVYECVSSPLPQDTTGVGLRVCGGVAVAVHGKGVHETKTCRRSSGAVTTEWMHLCRERFEPPAE